MKLLVTGRGTSGSWCIRGQQLGTAIGATVQPQASKIKGFDLCVVVKRAPADLLHRIRDAAVPLVLDVVDGWPQPAGNDWPRDRCMEWLRGHIEAIQPVAIVAATQAMAADVAEVGFTGPVLALPHHSRPGQPVNPHREQVCIVGYEGSLVHLGRWNGALEDECSRRGWRFVVNPKQLSDLDIVVALRDAHGYAARNWKSNCKLANAMGSATPFIGSREAGYLEQATGAEQWADTSEELRAALDAIEGHKARLEASRQLVKAAPLLSDIAAAYRTWMEGLE